MDGHSGSNNDGVFLLSLLGYNDGSRNGDRANKPFTNIKITFFDGTNDGCGKVNSLAPCLTVMHSQLTILRWNLLPL